jgi:sugar/nucleoside kinase (ribokinase family)
MYDLVTIGDIKLDVFISLDNCKEKCDMKQNKITFMFGEKISIDVQDQQVAGSAPNVAVALSRLGKKSAVISNMGADQTHSQSLTFLKKEGVDPKHIKAHKGVQSAYSAVLNLQGEKTILVSYIDKKYSLPKNLKTTWVYMSEMGSGYEQLYKQLITHIKKTGTKLGFNPGNKQIAERKQALYDLIKHTQVLIVNVEEGQRIARTKTTDIKTLAKKLYKLGAKELIITDGRKGSYAYDGDTLYQSDMYPGPRVEATGAGDSFAAAYIGARLYDKSMEEGLRWGAVNSAEVVLHVGPTPGLLKKGQIEHRLRKNPTFKPRVIS